MAAGPQIEFDDGLLYALPNVYPVDGRVSRHPPAARGLAPMNSYLLRAGPRSLLIDSGLTVHRDSLLAGLDSVLPPGGPLSVLHTRLGEYDTLSNTPAVVARFEVEEIFGAHANADLWTDFEPHDIAGETDYAHAIDNVRVRVLGGEEVLDLDPDGGRRLHVFPAVLRLLPTHWAYDEATATLFTSDMFTHVIRQEGESSWVVTEAEDRTSPGDVREHLLGARYWWLAEADTREIAAGLAEVFARHRVERIAPGYGCILDGGAVVERHVAMVQEVLAGGDVGPAETRSRATAVPATPGAPR